MLTCIKSSFGMALSLWLAAGLPVASAQVASSDGPRLHVNDASGFVAGRVLVKFRTLARPAVEQKAAETAALARVGGKVERVLRTPAAIRVVAVGDVEAAVRLLRADPAVEIAEPDYIRRATGSPNDPYFSLLWGLKNTGQSGGTPGADSNVVEAWKITQGSPEVVVAVLDSGIDLSHPDLAANIWTNTGEKKANGLDDDHNGYADDVHGWDFVSNDAVPQDDADHGTHVSGTIAAVGNNSQGVIGVAPSVRILPLRFIDGDGRGTVSDEIEAISYAIRAGARIANCSFGAEDFSALEEDALRSAEAAGMLVVAAAGNDGSNTNWEPGYPASLDLSNIIAVAATDDHDQRALFSNYGAGTVHIAAPGVNILSTLPGGAYGYDDGTSMASPHVAGVAALVLSQFPALGMEDLRNRVVQNARLVPELWGSIAAPGVVDAAAALTTCPADADRSGFLDTDDFTQFVSRFEQGDSSSDFDRSGFVDTDDFDAFVHAFEDGCPDPTAPTGLSVALASATEIVATWSPAPGNIHRYRLERTGDGVHHSLSAVTGGDQSAAYVGGLPELSTQTFRVWAIDGNGESGSNEVNIQTGLAAPSDLLVDGVEGDSVFIEWFNSSRRLTSQRLAASTDGGTTWYNIAVLGPTAWEAKVGGLALDTPYLLKLRSAADSIYSEYSNTVSFTTAPAAPAGLNACNVWATTVDLCWTDTSRTETEFRIAISRDGGATWDNVGVAPANATSFRVNGLDPASVYLFKVRGYNGFDYSAYSNTIQVATADVTPADPSGLMAENVWARTIDLKWSDNSGNESEFLVAISTDGVTWNNVAVTAANTPHCRIESLHHLTRYYFKVRAANSVGYSGYSQILTVDTLNETPDAPSNLVATNIWSTKVDLAWTDTADNEAEYRIARSDDGGATWHNVGMKPANSTSFRDENSNLKANTTYLYKVRCGNAVGYSEYSNTIIVKTKP